MAYFLDTLPPYIEEVILSDEYDSFVSALILDNGLNDEQGRVVEQIITDLFVKKIQPRELTEAILSRLGVTQDVAKMLVKNIILNIVLVFPQYFGDYSEYYRELGGSGYDLRSSPTFVALANYALTKIKGKVEDLDKIDVEGEATAAKQLFSNQLVETIKAPEGDYKASFNNMLIAILARRDGFAQELVQSILLNPELIGTKAINVEGQRVAPNVSNWIKDYLTYAEGNVSTITIAKYIAESSFVRELSVEDREALGKLLETFRVLRTFPDSLAKVPPEQWMIIPFRLEETTSAAPITAESGVAQVVQPTTLSALSSQAPDVYEEVIPISTTTPASSVVNTTEAVSSPAPIPVSIPSVSVVQESSENITPNAVMEVRDTRPISVSTATISMEQYQEFADMVIDKSGLFFGNEQIKRRVKNSIVTRLKDVRDPFELKAVLIQAVEAGGAGLAEQQADLVVREAGLMHDTLRAGNMPVVEKSATPPSSGDAEIAPITVKPNSNSSDTIKDKHEKIEVTPPPSLFSRVHNNSTVSTDQPVMAESIKPSISLPVEDAPFVPDNLPVVTSTLKSAVAKPTKQANAPRLTIEEIDGVPTIVQKSGEERETSATQQKKAKPETTTISDKTPDITNLPLESSSSEEGISIPVLQRKTAPSPYRVPLADVKVSPQLIDPVEELRIFTLNDFRRLHSDPMEAVKRIYQKIQLLEKDSLSKRQAGIAAWQENEISRIYREVGTEVFRKGVAQEQVMAERASAGIPVLSDTEMDALMELNEMIRF